MQSLLDATQPKGRRYYWKSHYLPGIDRAADRHSPSTHAARIRSPHSAILLFQIGGALGELPAGHSPAGNRDAAYVLNIAGSWETARGRRGQHRAGHATASKPRALARPAACTSTSSPRTRARDRIEAAYGSANLHRLAELKRRLDPDALFRHTKSVLA